MAVASVMVPVDLEPGSRGRVAVARSVAARFSARLVGVAAREALPVRLYGKGAYVTTRIVGEEDARAAADLARAERVFRDGAGPQADVAWRARSGDLMAFLTEQARAADLVVVGRQPANDDDGWCAGLAPGELILRLGRPVLIVPPGVAALAAARIVVAWKDTREARRAVRDALPFLAAARSVCIATVGPEAAPDGAEDVADHLARHGVAGLRLARPQAAGSVAQALVALAHREEADLIVAGAYGHSRLRERIFGSVTRQLLAATPVCCLMSH
ncbi:hypothetical protein OPKNFCMD_1778 [Methylobacterium crusticola]|uniref:UspA domain-containing protein n=1 Tax=Methylobacterium crusticola TaxID=1697972 RepID=A0ABQ4QV06_9HYPH|nr:universal stress protein [Methylobacterium crusticola]GJD49049.1 hypothetical protein OPKNFCMD_1778 [Methylobacterium crusticola]